MKTQKMILLAVLGLLAVPVAAQVRHSPADSVKAERILWGLAGKTGLRSGEMLEAAALEMLGTPYVAGTLDIPGKETLTVELTRTDCILLVETCFNLTLCAQRREAGYYDLCDRIRDSRYRHGEAGAYADRIHYTTEWVRKGISRGLLTDLTGELGGVTYDHHPINFMGTHPEKYPLMDNPAAIRAVEAELNKTPVAYIPKERIPGIEKEILPGDIICFVTRTPGLDISHTAIAHILPGGKAGFIHASSVAGKVIVDSRSIAEYAVSQRSCIGIQVVRMTEKADIQP